MRGKRMNFYFSSYFIKPKVPDAKIKSIMIYPF